MCIAGSPPFGVCSVSTSAFPVSDSSKSMNAQHSDSRATILSRRRTGGRVTTEAEGGASLGALHGQQRFAAEGADLGLARGHVIRAEGAGDHGTILDPEPGFKSRGHS